MSAALMPGAANVFTYGSLMYPQVWERVVRGRYRSALAALDGFRRHALAGVSYPGVVEQPGARVLGRVYFDVPADDLARLDAFESTEYQRCEADVTLLDTQAPQATQPVRAQLYVYLRQARLLQQDWDQARFERDHLADFARVHQADVARGL
jgi:gamma-glutamylcyclotransferase (GGCT)/AIG2-like uncharacterized protein YtfP